MDEKELLEKIAESIGNTHLNINSALIQIQEDIKKLNGEMNWMKKEILKNNRLTVGFKTCLKESLEKLTKKDISIN